MVNRKNITLILIIITLFILTVVFSSGLLVDLELLTYDYRLILKNIFTDRMEDENIVLIKIDNKSIEELGSWPWSRDIHAHLIETLNKNNVELIAFDILFDRKKDFTTDQQFLETLKKYNNVILASSLNLNMIRTPLETKIFTDKINYPYFEFEEYAHTGYINLISDHDGKIRRVFATENITNEINSFSMKIFKLYNKFEGSDGNNRIEQTDEHLLFNKQEKFINFHHQNYIPKISYIDVLNKNFNSQFFEDKIAVIGVSSEEIIDYWSTPLSPIKGYTSGYIIHGEILHNYINNSFIYKFHFWVILFLLLVFTPVSFIIFYKITPLKGILSLGGIILLKLIISLLIFIYYHIFIFIIPFIFISLFNYIASNITWYYKVENKRKQLKEMFSRYLAPEVVNEFIDKKEISDFTGKRVKITVVFVDLVNFTSYSEKNSPETVVKVLNKYLKIITEEVFEFKGTLDKFLGDGAMIFFGAPVEEEGQEKNALKMAVNLQNKINNREDLPLEISIGINTGEAVVGNIGSKKRIEYTAIGDTVNTAQRIENLAAGRQILAGESTYSAICEKYEFELDNIKVKGRTDKIKVFKLINFLEG